MKLLNKTENNLELLNLTELSEKIKRSPKWIRTNLIPIYTELFINKCKPDYLNVRKYFRLTDMSIAIDRWQEGINKPPTVKPYKVPRTYKKIKSDSFEANFAEFLTRN